MWSSQWSHGRESAACDRQTKNRLLVLSNRGEKEVIDHSHPVPLFVRERERERCEERKVRREMNPVLFGNSFPSAAPPFPISMFENPLFTQTHEYRIHDKIRNRRQEIERKYISEL